MISINAIASNLRHCEDLSEMVAFVADMAAGTEGAVVLSDPDVCARVWRGVAGVHAQIRESLVLAQAAAEQLHATVVDLREARWAMSEAAAPRRLPSLLIAQRFLALGLSVIPVPRPRPGVPAGQPGDGKVPAIAWSEYQERRPTASEIDAWFGAAPMNLAVITGQVSGVVVVDADEPEALRWLVRRLPWTPWQTQTARGFHLWYRHPGVRVPNRARVDTGAGTLKIDVRGDGGYVIAPGSVHASGAAYLQAGDWSEPRARVPVFWPGWLARPSRPPSRRSRHGA